MKFGGKFVQTKLLSRLSHKVYLLLSSTVLLRKFSINGRERREAAVQLSYKGRLCTENTLKSTQRTSWNARLSLACEKTLRGGEELAGRLGYPPLKNWTYFEEHTESQKHTNKQYTTLRHTPIMERRKTLL